MPPRLKTMPYKKKEAKFGKVGESVCRFFQLSTMESRRRLSPLLKKGGMNETRYNTKRLSVVLRETDIKKRGGSERSHSNPVHSSLFGGGGERE